MEKRNGERMKDLREKVEREQDKLARLVNKAIKDNLPIGTNGMILTRSRKLDSLIGKLANQKEKSSEY